MGTLVHGAAVPLGAGRRARALKPFLSLFWHQAQQYCRAYSRGPFEFVFPQGLSASLGDATRVMVLIDPYKLSATCI